MDADDKTPWNELPAKVQKAVLYGTRYKRRGRLRDSEGVVNTIKRLYHETQSEGARPAAVQERLVQDQALARHRGPPGGSQLPQG